MPERTVKRGRLRRAWPVGAGLVAGLAGVWPGWGATEPGVSIAPPAVMAAGILAGDPASRSDADKIRAALDSTRTLEDRRYLLYLYARLNCPRVAEALARRILEEHPGDRRTWLVLARMYLERKEAERLTQCAQQVLACYPNDSEARYFLASGHLLAGRYAQAESVYRSLKERNDKDESFPYAADLAYAAAKAGHWREAMGAYQQTLRSHSLNESTRLEMRQALEVLYREHLPRFSLATTNCLLRPGQVFSLGVDYRRHVTEASRLRLGYQGCEVRLEGGGGLNRQRTRVNDGQLGLTTDWSNQYTTGIWGGAGTGRGMNYGMGGAEVWRDWGGERRAGLDGRLGERALDSLLIESLNGREHRWSASWNYRLEKSWHGRGSFFGREVTISRQAAGWGGGGEWSLERPLLRGHPEWRAGYQGSYSRFSWAAGAAPLLRPAVATPLPPAGWEQLRENAIRSELHREGVYTVWRGNTTGVLAYYALVGVDYAFDRSAWEYRLGCGCGYSPRKSIEVTPEVSYSSGANTSDVDAERLQIGIAVRSWF